MTIKRTVTPEDVRALTTAQRRGYNRLFTRAETTIIAETTDIHHLREYQKAVDGRLLAMASIEDMLDFLEARGSGLTIRLDLGDPFDSIWTAFRAELNTLGRAR